MNNNEKRLKILLQESVNDLEIHELLYIYRKRNNLKQDEMEKVCSIPRKNLSEIENRKRYITDDLVTKLIKGIEEINNRERIVSNGR